MSNWSSLKALIIGENYLQSISEKHIRCDGKCCFPSSKPLINLFMWDKVSPSAGVTGLACSMEITLALVGTMDSYNFIMEQICGKSFLRSDKINPQQSATYWGFYIISLWATSVIISIILFYVILRLQSNADKNSSNSSSSH